MSYLSKKQVDQLLWPIRAERVSKREKKSHLEAYDVRAHLTRVFGFGRWSGDVLSMEMLFEQVVEKANDKGEKRWVVSVGYRALYRLTVCEPQHGIPLATYTESAAGDAVNFPINKRGDAHDFAIKTAESQALKRCATNLGDQFGLSLYNDGSVKALVGGTHHYPFEVEKKENGEQQQDKTDTVDVSAHVTSLAPEVDPPDERESARITQQARPNASNGAPPDYEPPPAAEPDENTPPQDDWRTRIFAARDARELLGIKTEAVRAGVHKELTANRDGIPVTVGALVDAEIAQRSRRKAS